MKSQDYNGHEFLPVTKKEVESLGWDRPDVILFSGDAYVDHPSFGTAVIGRIIQDEGLKVAIVPQPNWKDDLRDFRKLGAPKYFFGISAGNMDSMVNHYTAAKRLRSDDAYSPGGKAGFRPDYPVIVYTRILKKLFPEIPVVLGGIEASMRRLTHFDYWSNRLEPSILRSSGADMLIYGMGEQPIRELVRLLEKGIPFESLDTINQTVILRQKKDPLPLNKNWKDIFLSSYEDCLNDRRTYADNFIKFEKESNKIESARITEPSGDVNVIVNPPWPPMTEKEADHIYSLPFTYLPHPKYRAKGPIPAYEMIKFSVNIHRGCFGGCSFCAISAHQGKQIVRRSEKSILEEIERISKLPDFKGYLSDLGGPSANMYSMKGSDKEMCIRCSRPSCIWPSVCRNLETSHRELTDLYIKVNRMPGIKKAFIGSGVRYDMLFREWNDKAGRDEMDYLSELIKNHVSGRLKVAPEHTSQQVITLMRKSPFSLFRKLKRHFDSIISQEGLKYEIVPYFISSHPGSSDSEMAELAGNMEDMGIRPEQVQDFTPTPMTLSTAMYYCGFDPYTGKKVFVARDLNMKKRQKEYFFWYRKPGKGENTRKRKPGNKSPGKTNLKTI